MEISKSKLQSAVGWLSRPEGDIIQMEERSKTPPLPQTTVAIEDANPKPVGLVGLKREYRFSFFIVNMLLIQVKI